MSKEMDFAQLVAQEDEIKILMAKCDELEAENAEWKEKAKVWMASPEAAAQLDGYRELGVKVAALEAENKRLRERVVFEE